MLILPCCVGLNLEWHKTARPCSCTVANRQVHPAICGTASIHSAIASAFKNATGQNGRLIAAASWRPALAAPSTFAFVTAEALVSHP